jgi:hypothetical protein
LFTQLLPITCGLAQDRANRGAIIEGGGLDSLMDVLQGSSSPAVRCAALEAVATLVKGDNKLKVSISTQENEC